MKVTTPSCGSVGNARNVTVACVPTVIMAMSDFGDFGNDPHARVVGDAEELVAGYNALALDDVLFDDVTRRRRDPIDRPRVGHGLAHLVDADFRDIEIAQLLHGAFEIAADT